MLNNWCGCRGSLETTIKGYWIGPCHSRRGMLKNPHCSMATSSKQRSKLAALLQYGDDSLRVKNSRVGRKNTLPGNQRFEKTSNIYYIIIYQYKSWYVKTYLWSHGINKKEQVGFFSWFIVLFSASIIKKQDKCLHSLQKKKFLNNDYL